jgi:hypothetical protein
MRRRERPELGSGDRRSYAADREDGYLECVESPRANQPGKRQEQSRMPLSSETLRRRIRILLWVFIAGVVASGVTALPLEAEAKLLARILAPGSRVGLVLPGMAQWLATVRDGLVESSARYPFLAYGTDWLAFGHFVIAIAFIGPLRHPVRNAWVVDFGMIACVLVVPFALVAGEARGIPLWWRLVDCSFGVFGIVPLWFCRKMIHELAEFEAKRV